MQIAAVNGRRARLPRVSHELPCSRSDSAAKTFHVSAEAACGQMCENPPQRRLVISRTAKTFINHHHYSGRL